MRARTLAGCQGLALVMLGLGSTASAACPWNGCGTDAYNAAQASASYAAPPEAYYASPPYAYSAPPPPMYVPRGYAYGPPVYGYSYREPYPAGYYGGQRRYAPSPYGR